MVLGIYGSGGMGRETLETALLINRWEEIVFIDDTVEAGIYKGVRRMKYSEFRTLFLVDGAELMIALGEPEYKISLYNKIKEDGYPLTNIIHPNAVIANSVSLGVGVNIRAGAVISTDVSIGNNVTIMEHVYIGHDSVLADNIQVSSNVSVGGHVKIGSGVFIGSNVCIKENLSVGEGSIIGIGSVVRKNVSEEMMYYNQIIPVESPKNGRKVFS